MDELTPDLIQNQGQQAVPQPPENVQEPSSQGAQPHEQEAQAQLNQAQQQMQPKKHEPPVGSPRWNEIYRENKELKRRLEALETLASQSMAQPQGVPDPQYVLTALRAKRREAAEALDFATMYDCDDQIRQIERALELQMQQQLIAGTTIQATQQQVLAEFNKNVEWFNRDSEKFNEPMAIYAAYLEQRLAPMWRGTYADLLSEVKAKTEEAFGYQSNRQTGPMKQPVTFVQGVSTAQTSAQQPVSLTEEERKIARLYFGDSPDAEKIYAEEKARRGRTR